MFTPWTFVETSSAPVKVVAPAPRYNCEGSIQIFLKFEAWQLSWSVSISDISETGVKCYYKVTDEQSGQRAAELEALLNAEPIARLQINHSYPEVFSPVLYAKLVRTFREQYGLGICFAYEEIDPHLIALIEVLSQNQNNSLPLN